MKIDRFATDVTKAVLIGTLLCLFGTTACRQKPNVIQTEKVLENGWYHIADGQKDSILLPPIVTVKDFVKLRLDTDFYGKYSIVAQVSKRKLKDWADATEKAIGKRIGFVFNDSVISDPQVNMRIENGTFQITNREGKGIKAIYRALLQEKKDSIDLLFKANGWETDSLLYDSLSLEKQDSIISALDYGEAQAISQGFGN